MIVAIHQPQYIPWLGYFGKMMLADAFVLLDTVQYVKNEWINRNRLRTPQGWQWLTVPVEYRFPQTILETHINHRVAWQRKHGKTLQQLYGKAPFFSDYSGYFEDLYEKSWDSLTTLNVEIIGYLMKRLGISIPVYRAAEMDILDRNPTGRLIEICRQLGATTYLSGAVGRDYLEIEQFEQAGLRLRFQAFQPPVYEQVFPGFEAGLSVVDLLFCQGEENARRLIASDNRMVDF